LADIFPLHSLQVIKAMFFLLSRREPLLAPVSGLSR